MLSDTTCDGELTLSTRFVLSDPTAVEGSEVSGDLATKARCVMAHAEEASVCPEPLPEA